MLPSSLSPRKTAKYYGSFLKLLFIVTALGAQLQAEQSVKLSWAPNPEPDIAGYIVYYGAASGNYTNAVNVGNVTTNVVNGLLEGVSYYFMVTAYNTWGLESAPSQEVSYAVPPVSVPTVGPPTAGTLAATVNNATSAVLSGAVNPNGAATVAWFEYGLTTSYGFSAGRTNLGSGSSTLWLNVPVNGLLPGTTYYYRIVATNQAGASFGSPLTFRTPATLSTVLTQPASSVAPNSAVLNAMVNPNGSPTAAWFQWGLDSNYGFFSSLINLGNGNTPLAINAALEFLDAGATYSYRIIATNAAGTSIGSNQTFTTALLAPLATTQPATAVGSATAILNASVNPNGDATTVWFEYGLNTSYGQRLGSSNLVTSTDVFPVSSTLSGLSPNTTYYFRVGASNRGGTTYGASQVFVTSSVGSSGGAAVTLSWQPNPEPDIAGYIVYYGVASQNYTNAINVGNTNRYTIGGLVEGVTYYFMVTAYNTWGLESAPSQEVSYTVPTSRPTVGAPVVATQPATDIISTAATFNGSVNPNGAATMAWFEYGISTAYGSTTSFQNVGNGNTAVPFNSMTVGLQPGVTYHYRLVASNSVGVVRGTDASFATPPLPPLVLTQPANVLSSQSATLSGTVNPGGAPTTAWFEYGASTSYDQKTTSTAVSASNTATPVDSSISGLLPGNTYYYRLVAQNSVGTASGADLSFIMPATAPLASTQPATDVGSSTASLSGTVNPNGAATAFFFEYGLDTSYGLMASGSSLGSGNTAFPVRTAIAGLLPGATYHFRVVATNQAGTSRGSDSSFTTVALPPVVLTDAASDIDVGKATLQGDVTPNGVPTVAWFEYGLDSSYASATPRVSVGNGSGSVLVSNTITGLLEGATYHYRLVASNSLGVVAGDDLTFAVPDASWAVITLAPNSVSRTKATLRGEVNPQGTLTTAWFEYGTDANYGFTTTVTNLATGTNFLPVEFAISGLQGGSTWHYRTVASNSLGQIYGDDVSFITPNTDTIATTMPARSVTATEATLYGTVTPYARTSVYFQYGLTTNLLSNTSTVRLNSTGQPIEVNRKVSGLQPLTTYYYRVVAAGKADTAYGAVFSFTTSAQ